MAITLAPGAYLNAEFQNTDKISKFLAYADHRHTSNKSLLDCIDVISAKTSCGVRQSDSLCMHSYRVIEATLLTCLTIEI